MENLEELKQFLKKKVTSSFKVVIMPDFFLDHFIKFEDDFETVMEKMKAVVERVAYLTNPAGSHQNLKEILSFTNRNKLREIK